MKDFRSLFLGKEKGVTFFELLIVIAIIGILAAIAVPNYGDYVERQRLIGATEAVYSQLQLAKRTSVSNNKTVYLLANNLGSDAWCATLSEDSSSDCSNGWVVSTSNLSVRQSGDNYPGITLTASGGGSSSNIGFVMPGVTVLGANTMILTSSRLGEVRVSATAPMQLKVCSDALSQYPDC